MFDDDEKLKLIFSLNMRNLMCSTGASEIAISNEIGISQSAINRIKNGVVSPTLFQAIKIAAYFKVDIKELITEGSTKVDQEGKKYIPILNAADYIRREEKNINGFYQTEDPINNSIGFKYDNSFSCGILNKDAIVIIKKISQKDEMSNGITLLYLENNFFKIGTVNEGIIRPIDNLLQSISVKKVKIIGSVLKIETKYIKDRNMIEKIKASIGTTVLKEFLSKNLAFAF